MSFYECMVVLWRVNEMYKWMDIRNEKNVVITLCDVPNFNSCRQKEAGITS